MKLLNHLNLDNVRFLRPSDAAHYATTVAAYKDLVVCVCPEIWADHALLTAEAYKALTLVEKTALGFPIDAALAATQYSTVTTEAEICTLLGEKALKKG